MNLKILLIAHAIITLAAGVVLIVSPGLIPSAVNLQTPKDAFLVCYLLAASEIAFAILSFSARNIADLKSLRLISITFIILHMSSAVLEVYDYSNGLSGKIWSNVLLRIIVSILFYYYGVYKLSSTHSEKTNA